eukprot:6475424-Amphidinium_carterae.2
MEAYLAVVSTRIDVHEWLTNNEHLHKLILPQSALRAVLSLFEDSPWSDVRAELLDVMQSSMLGRRLFAFAASEGIAAAVDTAIVEEEQKLLKESKITAQVLRTYVTDCVARCERVLGVATLDEKREVTLRYRGQPITVPGRAAESGTLKPLPMESLVFKDMASQSTAVVDATVVQKAKSARAFLKERVDHANKPCAETVQDRYKTIHFDKTL